MGKDKIKILDKKILRYYLECDRIALHKNTKKPRFFRDAIWRFQILLRKTEFWSNQKSALGKLIFYIYYFIYKKKCERYNVEIPLNCIGEGLVIWHLNGIIINPRCCIGSNFSMSAGVVIGHAKSQIPHIGDNVHVMLGTKILGANICDNVTIGAASLVLKDIVEPDTVWAGHPARKISTNIISEHVKKAMLIKEIKREIFKE